MIEEDCRFLCGACSCQIKQQNPGVDMPMSVDWSGSVTGSAMRDIVLPELTGVGAFEVADAATDQDSSGANDIDTADAIPEEATTDEPNTAEETASVPAGPTVDYSAGEGDAVQPFGLNLVYWMGGVIAVGLVIAVTATCLLRRTTAAQ